MKPIIRVENLGKQYRIGRREAAYATLRESLVGAARAPFDRLRRGFGREVNGYHASDRFWALKDVSFEVKPGEVVGIVGRNGAGKSTLLKILSRVTEPTEGKVDLYGRVGSLLEVGTGFHPELTGRENIYLNGSILGMRKAEIDRKFDEMVEFAEVEKFLDTPVKRYSTGMGVRLAFAVAAHLEPEILVVDEVLAVGDAQFQKKCLGKMSNVASHGRTVLFVSHNVAAIQNLCNRCLLLKEGRLVMNGRVETILSEYMRSSADAGYSRQELRRHSGRVPDSVAAMREIRVRSDSNENESLIRMGDDVTVEVFFEVEESLNDVTFGLQIKNHLGIAVFGNNTLVMPASTVERPLRSGVVRGHIPRLPLMPGVYSIDLYLGSNGQNFDVIYGACFLEVSQFDVFGTGRIPPKTTGSIFWPITWVISRDSHLCVV